MVFKILHHAWTQKPRKSNYIEECSKPIELAHIEEFELDALNMHQIVT